jgi:hypothetical protein
MMYNTKIALVIRADLLPWQIANVAAFLSGGLAGTYPEIVGEPYRDPLSASRRMTRIRWLSPGLPAEPGFAAARGSTVKV